MDRLEAMSIVLAAAEAGSLSAAARRLNTPQATASRKITELSMSRPQGFDGSVADGRNRRTAAARRQAETLLQRPVFGVERPLSNARRIRGSCGRDVPIERSR